MTFLLSSRFCLLALFSFSVSSWGQNSSPLVLSGYDELISAVECRVKNAGTLKSFLEIRNNSLLRIESFASNSTTILIDGAVNLSGFSAVLRFKNRLRKFSLNGTETFDDESLLAIELEGYVGIRDGNRNQARFLVSLHDHSVGVVGSATLTDCVRIH